GRHEKFFTEVTDFRCPECGAPREKFFDINDPYDPRNAARNAEAAGE
ncbi:unnamed protein product, partial [Phaeothamnion confervicola]